MRYYIVVFDPLETPAQGSIWRQWGLKDGEDPGFDSYEDAREEEREIPGEDNMPSTEVLTRGQVLALGLSL